MSQWDERYGGNEFFYGTEPNDFLRGTAALIRPRGRVLCLAEGEGRNAVYLASLGYEVTAMDASPVGLEKLQRFAKERGLVVRTIVADLNEFEIGAGEWDGIVSIWCHLPKSLRAKVHRDSVRGLRPGGFLLLEAYRPEQLEHKTGGPPVAELMMTLPELQEEFSGLRPVVAREVEREIQEGKGHRGLSATVQLVAVKE